MRLPRRPVVIGLLALAWVGTSAADIQPYSARYSIYRNGSLTGKVEVALQRQEEQWVLRSEGSGTHGLARILRARDHEQVSGILEDSRFTPLRYQRHTRVAGIDDRWLATFDREAGEIRIVHDENDAITLQLPPEALDPLSLKLEMRRRLAEPAPNLEFLMVEEDEIDEQNFRILPTEWLETSLGCLETLPVEKIRRNSKRYTRAWHAPGLGLIEVRMEHGKIGGNHLEMRITELKFSGQIVRPRAGCSAMQQVREASE